MRQNKALGFLQSLFFRLQKSAHRVWYMGAISVLAFLDNFVIVVPTDGILISSTLMNPRRWFFFALSVAIGSAFGALLLASFVENQGLPWVVDFFPEITSSQTWNLTIRFFERFGLFVVFFVSVTPLMQQPAVVIASLANIPLLELGLVIFIGRLIKFLIMAYLGSHAPKLIYKLWGVQSELQEVGVLQK